MKVDNCNKLYKAPYQEDQLSQKLTALSSMRTFAMTHWNWHSVVMGAQQIHTLHT